MRFGNELLRCGRRGVFVCVLPVQEGAELFLEVAGWLVGGFVVLNCLICGSKYILALFCIHCTNMGKCGWDRSLACLLRYCSHLMPNVSSNLFVIASTVCTLLRTMAAESPSLSRVSAS